MDCDLAKFHRFPWLKDQGIGEISTSLNWLVGEYNNPTHYINTPHWTIGRPYFNENSKTEFSNEWKKKFESTIFCKHLL